MKNVTIHAMLITAMLGIAMGLYSAEKYMQSEETNFVSEKVECFDRYGNQILGVECHTEYNREDSLAFFPYILGLFTLVVSSIVYFAVLTITLVDYLSKRPNK